MNINITAGSLFLEGLLSFFSPCVLPLIPLYISYITKDAREKNEDGTYTYQRGKTFLMTLFFVLGICTVFFLAGLGSSALRTFFSEYKVFFRFFGGTVLLFFGLVSLHIIEIPALNRTFQKNVDTGGKMTYLKAWLMGFFFSFAWSPCIGPMLMQAIILSSSADTAAQGWLLIGSYTLGFILMFLLLGLFTSEVLNLLKKHKNVVQYTGTIAGIVILCMGVYMIWQGFTSMEKTEEIPAAAETGTEADPDAPVTTDMFDFTLPSSQGGTVTLSELKGKVVVLSFYKTWCTYCNEELPTLQKIEENMDDVKVLIVATPKTDSEGSKEYVTQFLREQGCTSEIIYDDDLKMSGTFRIEGYPTTFFINKQGEYTGYFPGYAPEEMTMEYINSLR